MLDRDRERALDLRDSRSQRRAFGRRAERRELGLGVHAREEAHRVALEDRSDLPRRPHEVAERRERTREVEAGRVERGLHAERFLEPRTRAGGVVGLEPKLWDLDDPLAGVGVAWKLAWAVAKEIEDPDGRRHIGRLLDLVSIGTVVDIAPLVGDNRALAMMGLRHINRGLSGGTARTGIQALDKVAGVRGELDEEDLGWRLGPRLNSIGRIKNPRPALELLLTQDPKKANRIAWELNGLNSERQRRT
ncbi:MAG: hypothetical protein M3Y87_12920, partial [Myxococcota bacterium]|nr:hypothetical protein [Myxococcota bacterium]